MASWRQIPPTAGHPISIRDVLSIGKRGSLAQDMRDFIGVPYARVTCSGTVALYLSLLVLKDMTPKRTIVIPAFICPLVGLAAARAGFKIAVCDMQQGGQLDYDFAQLDALCSANNDIAVLLVAHLGGMPANLAVIKALADAHALYIIEDCAQALGAEYNNAKVGTIGDFGFFSFARGKGMTLYEGGVLVTRHAKFAAQLDAMYQKHVPRNFLAEAGALGGLMGYALFYRPRLFWFIFDITYLLWNFLGDEVRGAAEYNTLTFPVYKMSSLRQKLGHVFFKHVDQHIARQQILASEYFKALESNSAFRLIRALPNSKATYPYITLVFPSREKRDTIMVRLRAEGLGAFLIYIRALQDYDYMKPYLGSSDYPKARHIADCSLTLSTNFFVCQSDMVRMVRLLSEHG